MSNHANSLNKGLTMKDLVAAGIFTALVLSDMGMERKGNL